MQAVAVPVRRRTKRGLSLPQKHQRWRVVAYGAGFLLLASPGGLARLPMLMSRSRRSEVRFGERSGNICSLRDLPVLPSRPGEFHPEPLTDPDLTLSRHPARATARRLPPSVENSELLLLPVDPLPTSVTCLLRSTGITPASLLLRSSPPLAGASVLSASRFEPLVPFPLASPSRFSRSVQEPG